MSIASSRLVIHQSVSLLNDDSFAEDVHLGLSSIPKTLKPKYFYDALGSQLFEAICLLPEYYLTRSEAAIFERYSMEIVGQLPPPISIVELGSGSSVKTRHLIEAALGHQRELLYQPIDISATILDQSAEKLLKEYPKLRIAGQVCDYTRSFAIIERRDEERVLVLFLGSNIGNYTPDEALALLGQFRRALRGGDGLLLGADLKKSAAILEQAYDDALGVTAAFNLNLLQRINRELGADFDLRQFEHRAVYNEDAGRVEMHLVSRIAQTVNIRGPKLQNGLTIEFQADETIRTENSYKYDLTQLEAMAKETGFIPAKTWFDSEKRFSCNFWLAID
jgi:dimethylhistidine N-methyltransferase